VVCPILIDDFRGSQLFQDKAQLAGNGRYPFQELQRRIGTVVNLPSGEMISYHLLCCTPCEGNNHSQRSAPSI